MLITKRNLINEFKNKKILITGGSGTIGVGLANQLIKFKPKNIRILSNDENSIFEMKKNLGKNPIFTFMMGDVRDRTRLDLAIKDIDIVFHAAAMKHIDICEQNPFDAVKTNVIGTSNILEASLIENISKFILISTDKATNPSSTLGASKLLAERLTRDASSYRGDGKTIFSIIRFGNVIGSRGSVFQIFLEQIKKNQTLTITDSKMTRFIMSILDATNLILEVTHIAKDGEVFILKMPSVTIKNLAKCMIDVCKEKFDYSKKISSIKTSNLREGERVSEYLITNEEIPYCEDLGKIFKITKKITNSKKVSKTEFNSSTSTIISNSKLKKIIVELLNEYE